MYEEVKEDLKKICLEEDYQVEVEEEFKKLFGDENSSSTLSADDFISRLKKFAKFKENDR